jgi:hemoglobin/transferrin/lactoferrin receptor protein
MINSLRTTCTSSRLASLALALLLWVLAPISARPALAATDGDDTAAPAPSVSAEAAANEGDEGGDGEKDDDKKPSYFTSVTVTATGSEIEAFEVATPVSVIDKDEIERKTPNNAADLLRDLPGVDVNGIGPNQVRPIIRGNRGLRVLFLADGLRMNNARRQTDFGEITGLVDIESVEAVEVVRGPASVLYGSDAIGGVLNLVSRKPPKRVGDPIGGSIGVRYGSAAEAQQVTGELFARYDKFYFDIGYTFRDAEDYEAAEGTFGDIRLSDPVTVIDTGLQDDSITGVLGYEFSNNHELYLRWNRYRADQTGFGFVEPSEIGEGDDFRIRILYPFQDFDRYTLGYVGSALDSALADTIEVQTYFQNNERELVNDIDINIGPIFPGAPDSSVEADTRGFTELETFGMRTEVVKLAGSRHALTYGAEFFEDDSFNTDSSVTTTTIRFPFPPFEDVDVSTDDVANAPNAKNTSYGAFLQDEIRATDRLKLTLGARYQTVETSAEPTPGWDVSGLDFDDDQLIGSINASYAIRDYLKLVGGVGTAFRAPSIIERLFNGPTPEGAGFQLLNPDLESERSENIDLGIKYQRRNAYFEAFVYQNDINDGIIQYFLSDDEIAALPPDIQDDIDALGPGAFVVQQRNIDRLRYQGIELGFGYRTDYGLTFGGNYTYLDVERRDSENPPTGEAPGDKASAFVRYEKPGGRYWIEYRGRYNGSEPSTVDPNEPLPAIGAEIPSFSVHDIGAGFRLFDAGSTSHILTLRVENVTDELYAEFSNASFFRPQPKRNFVAGYRVEF